MSKYYVVNANGQPTAVCAYPIPGLQCVPATTELDAAWAAAQADLPPAQPPTQSDILSARAAALLAEDAATGPAVLAFAAEVAALAQAGVVLPDPLTFQGLAQAIPAAFPNDLQAATAAALKLRNAWDGVVYHVGTLKQADELFPYLLQQVQQP